VGRDKDVPTEGTCSALIRFEGGAVAHISVNGYGYFSTSELTWDIGIFGERRAPAKPAPRRSALSAEEKYAPASAQVRKAGEFMPFAGLNLVSCERGLMRQSPNGLYLYTDDGREEIAIPPYLGRAAELIELRDALAQGRDVFPNAEWGKANLEICLAILQSARDNRDIELRHQTRSPSPVRRQ
jgi:phthalate 4,5-cis-dihydrodiol dehydrogenase